MAAPGRPAGRCDGGRADSCVPAGRPDGRHDARHASPAIAAVRCHHRRSRPADRRNCPADRRSLRRQMRTAATHCRKRLPRLPTARMRCLRIPRVRSRKDPTGRIPGTDPRPWRTGPRRTADAFRGRAWADDDADSCGTGVRVCCYVHAGAADALRRHGAGIWLERITALGLRTDRPDARGRLGDHCRSIVPGCVERGQIGTRPAFLARRAPRLNGGAT